MKKSLLFSALAVSVVVANAQPTTSALPTAAAPGNGVVQQIAMPELPTELTLKSLNSSWRRFLVRDLNPAMANRFGGMNVQLEQVLSDLGIGIHFTQGEHLSMGNETYLVAYRVDPNMEPQDLQQEIQQRIQAMWGHGRQQALPRPAGKFAPETTLKLSLLNLRNLGNLEDVRTFDPANDLLSPQDLRDLSDANLQRLGQFLQRTARQRPLQLRDINQLRQTMRNHHVPVTMLLNPSNNEPYDVNFALNGKIPSRVSNSKAIPLAYEAAPASDGTRGVLFLDWHVERVPEWKWAAVLARKPRALSAQEYRVISAAQMKRILASMQTHSTRRQKLPEFKNATEARAQLMRSTGYTPQIYQVPPTTQWYRFNTALSGVALQDVTNRNQVVAVYEPMLGSDGKRAAVFVDGVVRRVEDAKWNYVIKTKPQLKAKS